MELLGGCVCGGTRYVLRPPPVGLNDCYCIDCRRSAGAPYVTWGSVRRGEMQVTRGGLREVSHAARFRFFAACCGTPLFFSETKDSEWVDVTICSLDDPAAFRPEKSTWTEDKLPWVILDPKLPVFRRSSSEGV